MKNWMFLLTALTCYASLEGWNSQRYFSAPEQPSSPSHFPLSPDQEAFTEVSYLLWKPHLRDLDFGVKNAATLGGGSTPDLFNIKLEKPSSEWDSGARVAIGKYLPHHDAWDIAVCATYFYGNADKTSKANLQHGEGIAPDFGQNTFSVPSNKSSVNWRLNFFTWDLSIGRLFNLPSSITIHPYAGLRGALIDQDYHLKSFGQIPATTSNFEVETDTQKFKASSEFWGIGPRIGTNFVFEFCKHWSILGNIAASILYGRYDVKEKSITQDLALILTAPPFTDTTNETLKAKDHGYVIRPNLEGSFGLGWETWVQNNSIRLAPSFVLESSVWFAQNQFFDLFSDGTILASLDHPIPEFETVRRHGNLVFTGFTFNFQVDF
jgi:hypothetical protein